MLLQNYKKHQNNKFTDLLLWDIKLDDFDFHKGKATVIERTVELGTLNDWYFILNFYGEETVIEEVKKINSLMRRDINFVHRFLNIPLTDLKSYQSQLNGKNHWFE